MIKKEEIQVLNLFLKAGYSTRAIDKKLGKEPKEKHGGWISWKILKKYNLEKEDRFKLFIYNDKEAKKIIKDLSISNRKGVIDELIETNKPNNISRYYNTFFTCKSEEILCKALSGETKNIIQYFFNSQKKIVGVCQNKECKTSGKPELQTAHYSHERPEIFKRSALKYKVKSKDLYIYDIYRIFEDFLKSHSKRKSICFLCQSCHSMFDNKIKKDKILLKQFKNNIVDSLDQLIELKKKRGYFET
jgi:hypothetical protein